MVIYETAEINGQTFEHVYSDAGRYLVRGDQRWEEVYNPLNTGRTYTEGDPIPEGEGEAEEILDILLGGSDD